MKMKKCPKCGQEIPEEMTFCLHCMESTDKTVELTHRYTPYKRYIIIPVIISLISIGTAVMLLIRDVPEKNITQNSEMFIQTETITTTEISETVAEQKNSAVTETTESIITYIPETYSPAEFIPETIPEITDIPETSVADFDFENIFRNGLDSRSGIDIEKSDISFDGNTVYFHSKEKNSGLKCECVLEYCENPASYVLTVTDTNEYSITPPQRYITDFLNAFSMILFQSPIDDDTRKNITDMFEDNQNYGEFSGNSISYIIDKSENVITVKALLS